jgi:Protein kinase domain
MATGAHRWRQIEELYHAALEREPGERAALLERADPDVRREVESLLAQPIGDLPLSQPALWNRPGHDRPRDRHSLDRKNPPPQTATDLSTGLPLDPLDDARFAPGRIFASRYRIVSLLGRGAMGEVYRADDLRLGQVVALKLMSEAMDRRGDGLERLASEVRLARTIVHPNVCRVYDIGYAEGWHYLSMEYVDGETLASLLRRIGQPPPAKALAMARQLCAGVAAAHDRGVLHRDLKPSNIMVDGLGQIRILDFGLAVAAADDVREVAGTPAYMPPEQLAGDQLTMRSDIYSLGRVLLEMLPPGIDPQISSVVQACVARDPARRPDSAYAILSLLPPGDSRALIEGGLPTPAMVAATPTIGTLKHSIAWLLLAGIVIASFGIAWRAHVFNVSPSQMPKPPEVLAERAREILARDGSPGAAVDRAYWWSAVPGDDVIRFTYRESPVLLVPNNIFRTVTANDPPADAAGMKTVTLTADGLQSTVDPPPRVIFSSGRSSFGDTVMWIWIVIGFIGGSILAGRNLRAGEGDRKGARKLAVFVALSGILGGAMRAHHVPLLADELAWLLSGAGWAVVWGGFSWLAYVSFEPYLRRWWPPTLISWTRLLAGHMRDPLVGRDLLVGALAGLLQTTIVIVQFELWGRSMTSPFLRPALDALQSPAWFASSVVFTVLTGLEFTLAGAAGLVLLRLIVRRTWIAIAILAAAAVPLYAVSPSPSGALFAAALILVALAVLLRVGVLATVTMAVVAEATKYLPLTLDTQAWYFGQSLIVLLSINALAIYGFFVALAGRPAFGSLPTR